jgi:DNA-directed RNA polymerase specialized sigma24 family protein
MTAPGESDRDLVEVFELFLALRRPATPAERASLVGEIVLHPATRLRMREARRVVLRDRRHNSQLWLDVLQQGNLLLIERLTGGKLTFQWEGIDQFGGWLYAICHSALVRALEHCSPQGLKGTVFSDPHDLERLPRPAEQRPLWESLFHAIETIGDPLQRDIMLEEATGITVRESAERHGLPATAIFRLREQGVLLLRELMADELPGGRDDVPP